MLCLGHVCLTTEIEIASQVKSWVFICSYHIISNDVVVRTVLLDHKKKTALIFFSKRMKVGKEGIIIKLACGEVRKKKKVPSDDQSE